ncbi:MAG TPA: hypothetical protein PLR20_07060 [Syntrophales bacterium]|nr:hypothetical protein [Syntrophales bacterium]HOX93247.1 hypothetical protein [Syntrophales bacterium]HPI56279.1 hypothetical protein [Syntrophales bacterium]HPN24466.1 hypothetical protein [Syntrophales bacterium]HQM29096.1 hypothetical protein [Syntrophales bacterium]
MKEKTILFTFMITLVLLAIMTCAPQQEQGPAKSSPPKKGAAKKPPVKMHYLSGEVVAVNKAKRAILVRGKDGEVFFQVDGRTSIKIDGEPRRLADVTAGKRAAIRYIEVGDKNIARNVAVSTPPPEQKQPVEEPAKSDLPASKTALQP